jgi:hypothetical protein
MPPAVASPFRADVTSSAFSRLGEMDSESCIDRTVRVCHLKIGGGMSVLRQHNRGPKLSGWGRPFSVRSYLSTPSLAFAPADVRVVGAGYVVSQRQPLAKQLRQPAIGGG